MSMMNRPFRAGNLGGGYTTQPFGLGYNNRAFSPEEPTDPVVHCIQLIAYAIARFVEETRKAGERFRLCRWLGIVLFGPYSLNFEGGL